MSARLFGFLVAAALAGNTAFAQTDTTEEEFDYSNVGFADAGAKRFCSPKIEGLSPAKLISIGYDFQTPYSVQAGALTNPTVAGNSPFAAENATTRSTDGLRLACNIPVVSKTYLVWQMGANYWNTQYRFTDPDNLTNPLNQTLSQHGLRTAGINTTVFKPLNQKSFVLFQGSTDMSGTYGLSLQPAR